MSAGQTQAFPASARLKYSREFNLVRKQGRFFKTPHFLVYQRLNGLEHNRLGITASRKVGNAPQRNRVKRLLREVFRRDLKGATPSRDFSIIARRGAPMLRYSDVLQEIRAVLTRE
ncbi:MAG TPA: ribonuclease P protein component [Desulfobacteraceae bacterium]|nr:ribonuclease P protein component [Desulfobacteraceae bacterium]